MLSNEDFLEKAPPSVVGKEKDKLAERKNNLKRLKERLASLNTG